MSPNAVYLPNQTAPAEENFSPEALLVRNTLIGCGLETPMIETGLTPEQKYERIRFLM